MEHHLRTQTKHKSLCYLGYLGYLRNCEIRSEMQDIRLYSKAHYQTWNLFWHHTTNLNYHPSANLVFIWLFVGVERNMKYVRETSLKVSTRITQHQNFTDEKWDTTGVSDLDRILLDREETLKNGREKIWEEITRSIGNPASTDVTT